MDLNTFVEFNITSQTGRLGVQVSYEYYKSRLASHKMKLIVLHMLFCGKAGG